MKIEEEQELKQRLTHISSIQAQLCRELLWLFGKPFERQEAYWSSKSIQNGELIRGMLAQLIESKALSATPPPLRAYHEAGHAVMTILHPKVMVPFPASVKHMCMHTKYRTITKRLLFMLGRSGYDGRPRTRTAIEAHVRMVLAGGLAQQRFSPGINWLEVSWVDYQMAFQFVARISDGPEECNAYLSLLTSQARQLLERNWPAVEGVAERLINGEDLRPEEVQRIVQERQAADPEKGKDGQRPRK